jgi:hypothetical protein
LQLGRVRKYQDALRTQERIINELERVVDAVAPGQGSRAAGEETGGGGAATPLPGAPLEHLLLAVRDLNEQALRNGAAAGFVRGGGVAGTGAGVPARSSLPAGVGAGAGDGGGASAQQLSELQERVRRAEELSDSYRAKLRLLTGGGDAGDGDAGGGVVATMEGDNLLKYRLLQAQDRVRALEVQLVESSRAYARDVSNLKLRLQERDLQALGGFGSILDAGGAGHQQPRQQQQQQQMLSRPRSHGYGGGGYGGGYGGGARQQPLLRLSAPDGPLNPVQLFAGPPRRG